MYCLFFFPTLGQRMGKDNGHLTLYANKQRSLQMRSGINDATQVPTDFFYLSDFTIHSNIQRANEIFEWNCQGFFYGKTSTSV